MAPTFLFESLRNGQIRVQIRFPDVGNNLFNIINFWRELWVLSAPPVDRRVWIVLAGGQFYVPFSHGTGSLLGKQITSKV